MGNNKDKKWIGWDKPATMLSMMVIVLVGIWAYIWITGQGPKSVFEFDDGTTQLWTGNGVFDDAGKKYDAGLYKVAHAEQYQYPDKFPCTNANPLKYDPLNDKNGSLLLSIADLQVALPTFNFPANSNYWHIELISPTLSTLFQNKSEFEAYVGDMFGIDEGHITAELLLYIEDHGTINLLLPVGGGTEQIIAKNAWTKLSAKFLVPQGAYIRNAVIRIKGDWKIYKLYEGGLFVDHVAGVN
jgi:hypothetical protein